MTINKIELTNALKKALPGIENGKSVLDGADSFIFDNGYIFSYNDNISVSVPFEILNKKGEKVSGSLKAKEFYDLINRYSGEEIILIPKSNIWILKSKNAVAELTLLENKITSYIKEIIPNKLKWSKIPKQFIEGLALCQFDSNKSVLSGVYFESNIIASTDSVRINWYEINDVFITNFFVSDEAANEIIKMNNIIEYSVTSSWVNFKTDDGTIFSCKRLDQTKYPIDKIKTIIDTHKKSEYDLSNKFPSTLMDAINRASALSKTIESFNTVKLVFNTDNIEVYSERASGKYKETVEWDKPFKKEIEPISIYVDYSMIEHGLKYSKSFYIKETIINKNKFTRIIFKHNSGIQLISTFDGKY